MYIHISVFFFPQHNVEGLLFSWLWPCLSSLLDFLFWDPLGKRPLFFLRPFRQYLTKINPYLVRIALLDFSSNPLLLPSSLRSSLPLPPPTTHPPLTTHPSPPAALFRLGPQSVLYFYSFLLLPSASLPPEALFRLSHPSGPLLL